MRRTPVSTTRSLAARMGRWSAEHRTRAILGWIAFMLLAVVIGSGVGLRSIEWSKANVGQAQRADRILGQAGFTQSNPLTEMVVVQRRDLTLSDPAFRAAVSDVVHAIAPSASIHAVRSPLLAANRAQVSADGHTALVEFEMNGTEKLAEHNVDALTRAVSAVAQRHRGYYIAEAGEVSSSKALNRLFSSQVGKAGTRSLPLTLVILVLAFGSLVAALVPLALALSSVIGTIGLVSVESHLVPMDQNVSAVVLLVGLAVGVDYSLFYLRREREERAAGHAPDAALRAAAATSGRSVLVSGVTVIIAMAGMLLSGTQTFVGFALATMTVVAVAMLGSLTVLPALLSKLGDRVERGRVPLLGRRRRASRRHPVVGTILGPVLARPGAALLAAGALVVTLAIPTLRLHTAQSGLSAMPRSAPTVQTLDRIQAAFPGQPQPAVVAVKTNTDAPSFRRAVTELSRAAAASREMRGALSVDVNRSHTVARISVPLAGDGDDGTSNRALVSLRNRILPATLGRIPGATFAVTGETAASHDWNAQMRHSLPLVFAFVLTFAFLLMLASFRSLTIAVVSLASNLLSVAAAYGVVVAVFQYGWGKRALDFTPNGGVAPWLPMFLFVILFGLSMDYQVFILSRIREAFDRGLSTKDAVAQGITATAGTVTSAAIVMVGAFAIFATLPILDMKEMGVGLAAAVLIDATIIRTVLLPAAMCLLGERNWYLPRWLHWLPQLEPAPDIAPAPA